jgi:hypothetical protein
LISKFLVGRKTSEVVENSDESGFGEGQVTFASVTALLRLVVLLACWIPAQRATEVDPILASLHD